MNRKVLFYPFFVVAQPVVELAWKKNVSRLLDDKFINNKPQFDTFFLKFRWFEFLTTLS